MALIEDLEDVALGAVGVIAIILIVALFLQLKKLPKLPNFSDLWKKLLDLLSRSGNVAFGANTGDPNANTGNPEDDGIDPFQVHTGIEVQ